MHHTHYVMISRPAYRWTDSFLCTPEDTCESTILGQIAQRYPFLSEWGVFGTDWHYEVKEARKPTPQLPTLEGLKNKATINRVIDRCIRDKTWRSVCENECVGYLTWQTEKARKRDVLAVVKARYDAAGAGWNGRWQS